MTKTGKRVVGSFLGVFLMGALAVQAHAAPARALARELQFKIEFPGVQPSEDVPQALLVRLYFALESDGSLYYLGNLDSGDSEEFYWEEGVYARVTPAAEGNTAVLEIFRTDEESLIRATVSDTVVFGSDLADAAALKATPGEVREDEQGRPYWYDVELAGEQTAAAVQVEAMTRVYTSSDSLQALAPVSVTGRMDFSPCDGCEHGDQFMIEDRYPEFTVNVVEVASFGAYYEPDCEGTVHPWLAKLMELGVPFTFTGRVSALSSDYWEGNYWTAQSGKVYVGYGDELEVVPFLDSMPRDGEFTSYQDGVLEFKAADGKVTRIDVYSGEVVN